MKNYSYVFMLPLTNDKSTENRYFAFLLLLYLISSLRMSNKSESIGHVQARI